MNLRRELETAVAAAREAGDAVWRLRTSDEGVRFGRKAGWELVSEADLRAEEILRERIHAAFPDDAWLSEEHPDSTARLRNDRVWIVDPIDGTREYLLGVPEFAVSLALCIGGEPVVGVVYNPARDDLASAALEEAAPERDRPLRPDPVILVGRGEVETGSVPPLPRGSRMAGVGSVAYRLALLARGEGDATLTGYGRAEWDVAAGVALCRAAGLRATGVLGDPLHFNTPDPYVRGLLAAPPALHRDLLAHFQRLV